MGENVDIEIGVAEVVDYLRLSGQFAEALNEVVKRKIAVKAAKDNGIEIGEDELQRAADAFRIANGMNKASETEEWLASHGISLEALESFLETNLLVSKMKDKLVDDTDKEEYLASEAIQESIRNMVYGDWMAEQMK